jgi:monoamine oxidase
MARTPLMRSLVELAEDHRLAAAAGVPVDAVQAERTGRRAEVRSLASAGITRREFLAGTLAAGAAVTLAPSAYAAASTPTARIAIIGGGIAGLTVALTLADKGVPCTLYEASTRLGGRMHSDSAVFRGGTSFWANGQTSEYGGELIDTGHKLILNLANRYNLATANVLQAEPNGSEDTYYFFGQYYPRSQATNDFQAVHQAISADLHSAPFPTLYNSSTAAGAALDNMSLYQWIETRVPGGHGSPMGMLLDVAYNIEYGAETTDQSSLNLVYLLGFQPKPGNLSIFGPSDEKYHIVGGNQLLPTAIAADVANRSTTIQAGWFMDAIARKSDGSYALTFRVGSSTKTVVADQVVLALPFAVLRNLDYGRAGFTDLKNTAIEQLGAGKNGKLQLQFDTRYWDGMGAWPGTGDGNSYADTGYQNTWEVTRAQPGATGILVDYTGGNIAGSLRPSVPYSDTGANPQVAQYAKAFLKQIEPVYPGISRHWTGLATLSAPFLDPNLNLAYSYWKVGQYTGFSGYELVRQGNVHFAGEHCSINFQGFMEGGATEGQRAAGEVLGDLGVK